MEKIHKVGTHSGCGQNVENNAYKMPNYVKGNQICQKVELWYIHIALVYLAGPTPICLVSHPLVSIPVDTGINPWYLVDT